MNPFFKFLNRPLMAPEGEGGSSSGGSASPSSSGASAPSAPSSAGSESSSSTSGASPAGGAPSPTPASGKPASPQPIADNAFDFSGFGLEEVDDESQPEAATPQAPKPDEQKPAAEAQPQQPAGTQPAEAPQATQQPTGPQEASAPSLSPAEPEKIAQAMLGDLENLSGHLGQQLFSLSDEDFEALNTDMRSAIPKLFGKAFVRGQAAAMSQMARVVPAMVERFMKLSEARNASEGKFYSRWNGLNKAQHGHHVDKLARIYRAQNPQATLEQMVEDIGPLVYLAAKVPMPGSQSAANGQAGGAQSAAPGVRKPPTSPFTPAVGGGAASPPGSAPADPWSGYGAASPDEE